MPGKPSYDELVRRLEALEKAVQPQTMAQSLEKAWAPRGGEPRIIDANGKTLDYVPNIQVAGAVTTLDAGKQRAVITVPSPELKGSFSPDPAVDATEMAAFRRPADSVLQGALKTGTSGTNRYLQLVNRDGGVDLTSVTLTHPVSALELVSSGPQDTASLLAKRSVSSAAGVFASAHPSSGSECYGSLYADGPLNASVYFLAGTPTPAASGGYGVVATNNPAGGILLRYPPGPRILLRTGGTGTTHESNFMQVDAGTNGVGPIRRVVRGPFRVVVTTLAAGATLAGTVLGSEDGGGGPLQARVGTTYAVAGSFKGAAGTEDLLWSHSDGPGANEVSISVTNRGAVARSGTLRFYVISTA